MTAALPEIPEAEATGQTAEIYEDIQQCLDVKNVNLIYRYFATINGALPWTWTILRPYFANGQLERCAQTSLTLYRKNFLRETELSQLTLTTVERKRISETLDFYLKANPMNLFALQLIKDAVNRQGYDPRTAQIQLLPLSELQRRADSYRFNSLASEMMFYVTQGIECVRPTLLRQLAEWPSYLDSVAGFIRTVSCDAQFERRVESIYIHASAEIAKFDPIETTQQVDTQTVYQLGEFCEYFPRILIRMTLIADKLKSAL